MAGVRNPFPVGFRGAHQEEYGFMSPVMECFRQEEASLHMTGTDILIGIDPEVDRALMSLVT